MNMTREVKEETISWLKVELEQWEEDCVSYHPIKDALRVAIKAVEEAPCEDK